MNPVSVSDLAARLMRPLTGSEQVAAYALLDDAWAEVQARVPTVQARLDDSSLDPGLVVRVVTAMVRRVLDNPKGLRQVSIDDYMEIRDQVVSGGLLYATPDEVRLLQSDQGRLRSVRLVVHDDA